MPPAGGGREDCWSEGGTACLVDAWGARYLHLNRGNLRQNDWSEVAEAVNDRQDLLGRPRRTDVQCRNRIDTVKKKYKLEKSKPTGTSQWPLFDKFDAFMGPTSSSAGKRSPVISPPRHPRLMFTVKPRNPNPSSSPNVGGFSGGSWRFRPRESSSESSLGENDKELDGDEGQDRGGEKRKWEGLVGCERGGGEMGQLARAIVNFAGVYERVESAKQQQMMELERHRMEFVRELEFQRMKMFMEVQLKMERMEMKRRKKSNSRSGKRL